MKDESKTKEQLRHPSILDITERKIAEESLLKDRETLTTLLALYRMPETSVPNITSFIVEECIRISESALGFFGFINTDETLMVTHLWSMKAMEGCAIDNRPVEFSLGNAGIWAEAIRQHKPIIINNYEKPQPYKKGYPEGHVPITRLMSIPVIEGGRAVAISAVANKQQDYTESDALHLNLFLESVWGIIQRNKAEKELRKKHDELELRVQERTALLSEANEALINEISERRRAEEATHAAHKKIRAAASAMMMTEESARQRFALALHDSVAQTLAAAKFRLESLRDYLSPDGLELMKELQDLVGQSIQRIRSIMVELSPPILYELGFIPAIEWLAEKIKAEHGIPVAFRSGKKLKPMDDDLNILLFQATRELLLNVVKHAKAKRVMVRVSGHGNNVQIEVKDDGLGFDRDQMGYRGDLSRGFGLFSIRERLQHFDGQLIIQSEPGKGTRVTINVSRKVRKQKIPSSVIQNP